MRAPSPHHWRPENSHDTCIYNLNSFASAPGTTAEFWSRCTNFSSTCGFRRVSYWSSTTSLVYNFSLDIACFTNDFPGSNGLQLELDPRNGNQALTKLPNANQISSFLSVNHLQLCQIILLPSLQAVHRMLVVQLSSLLIALRCIQGSISLHKRYFQYPSHNQWYIISL